ncbi:MAG: hypothetical protein WC284_12230, partial [Candidimonas sp.]
RDQIEPWVEKNDPINHISDDMNEVQARVIAHAVKVIAHAVKMITDGIPDAIEDVSVSEEDSQKALDDITLYHNNTINIAKMAANVLAEILDDRAPGTGKMFRWDDQMPSGQLRIVGMLVRCKPSEMLGGIPANKVLSYYARLSVAV